MRRECWWCFWTKMSPESEWKPKIHLGWSNSPLLPASWTNHDDYCKWPLAILTWQPHNKRRRKRSRNCLPPHLAASPGWNLLWNAHNATTSPHQHNHTSSPPIYLLPHDKVPRLVGLVVESLGDSSHRRQPRRQNPGNHHFTFTLVVERENAKEVTFAWAVSQFKSFQAQFW